MKKILVCMLCLFSLCGCSQKSKTDNKEKESQVQKVNEIENNAVVLYDIKLKPNDTVTDINKYLDDYDILETESSAVFYSNDDIEIFVGMDKKVKKITVFTDTYVLDNNIKVGSSLKDIEKIYRNPDKENSNLQSYLIHNINVTFTINNDKISKIELETDSY